MVARRVLGDIRAKGDAGAPVIGFINGALTWEIIKRAPLLGLGKIIITPVAYVLRGGGKLAESIAVSDASILGLLVNIMLTARPEGRAERRAERPAERTRLATESIALSALRSTLSTLSPTILPTPPAQPAPRPVFRPALTVRPIRTRRW